MKLDDKWLDKIAQKVEAYEEVAPTPDWQRIQTDLDKELTRPKPRVMPLYPNKIRWSIAAALFIGVLSHGVYLANHTSFLKDNHVRVVAQDDYLEQLLPQVQQMKQSPKALETLAEDIQFKIPSTQVEPAIHVAKSSLAYSSTEQNPVESFTLEEIKQETNKYDTAVSKSGVTTDVRESKKEAEELRNMPPKDNLYAQLGDARYGGRKQKAKSLEQGFGLHMGSGGALNFSSVSSDQLLRVLEEVNIEALATDSPETIKNIQIKNGLPYIEKEVKQQEYDHRQPVSFGLNYRMPLSSTLSLETGLVYTYLSSKVKDYESGSLRTYRQKLHYLGVPLKLNWSFYEYQRFSFYASAGGMVEVGVAGKIDGKSHRPIRPQFSAAGGLGVQLAINKNIGFYIEPGMAYYFNDGSKLETIRKKKPFNFNLNTGFRLTF